MADRKPWEPPKPAVRPTLTSVPHYSFYQAQAREKLKNEQLLQALRKAVTIQEIKMNKRTPPKKKKKKASPKTKKTNTKPVSPKVYVPADIRILICQFIVNGTAPGYFVERGYPDRRVREWVQQYKARGAASFGVVGHQCELDAQSQYELKEEITRSWTERREDGKLPNGIEPKRWTKLLWEERKKSHQRKTGMYIVLAEHASSVERASSVSCCFVLVQAKTRSWSKNPLPRCAGSGAHCWARTSISLSVFSPLLLP